MSDGNYRDVAYADWMMPSRRSAQRVLPYVLKWVEPKSVIDVGCGLGMWARTFLDLGVPEVHGLDGETVPQDQLLIPRENFEAVDLSRPFSRDRSYDLVVSLEVGEHLNEEHAETFVDTLTSLGQVVLYSAAIPLQRGAHHVNEQWPEYWARKFAARGYRAVDCVRPAVWNHEDVEPYYCQNMVLYVHQDRLDQLPQLNSWLLPEGEMPLSLIHPHYYLKRSGFQDTSLKWWSMRLQHYSRAVLRRLGLASS